VRGSRRGGVPAATGAAGDLDRRHGRVVGPTVHIELDVELPVGDGGAEAPIAGGEGSTSGEDVERGQHGRAFDAYVEFALAGGVGPILDHLQRHLVGAVGHVELVAAPVVEQVVRLVERRVGRTGDRLRGGACAVQGVVASAAGAVGGVGRPGVASAVGQGGAVAVDTDRDADRGAGGRDEEQDRGERQQDGRGDHDGAFGDLRESQHSGG